MFRGSLKLLDEANEFDRQLTKKGLVLPDPQVTAYVESVGQRLVGDQPPLERVNFKFRVLRDPMINAFALPNGSIYVNSGLLAILENEGELASVLGHEIIHVTRRHAYLFNRSLRKKTVVINVIGMATGGYSPTVFGAVLLAAGAMSEAMVASTISGYSQEQEREADRNGLDLINHGGYDPRAMPRTFELLDERLEYEPVEGIYRSHPKLKQRRNTTQELADKLDNKDQRVGTEAEYLASTAPAISYNILADLGSRRARTALARAERLTRWQPHDANYLVLQADAYRVLGARTANPSEDELEKHGQSEDRKRLFKLTEEEEQKVMLAKPGGPEERRANFEKAEKYYLEAAQRDATLADPHRGLGFLYEEQARPADAVREYRRYLELAAPGASDRLRVERRADALERTLAPQATPQASSQPMPIPQGARR